MLCLIYSPAIFGNKVDSLKNIISKLPDNEKVQKIEYYAAAMAGIDKTRFLNEIADQFEKSNPTWAFVYAKKALKRAKKSNDEKGKAKSYRILAFLYFSPKLKYDSAKYFINKALEILKHDSLSNELGLAYNYAGIIQADQGNLEEGLKYFEKAEKVYMDLGNYCRAATIHHNIGKLNKYSKSDEEVEKYFLEALEMYKKYGCEENYDFLYDNLSELYISKKNFIRAKEMALKSLEISRKYNLVEGIGISYLILGEISYHIDTASVLPNYYKSLEIADSFKIVKLHIALYLDFADYFRMKNKLDKAKHYLNLALEKAKESHKLFYIQKSSKGLADIFSEKGDYKNAFEYYKQYSVFKDSISAEKVRLKIASLENDKKENKIRILNKENKIAELKARRSKILVYFSLLFIVLILIIFYFLFQNYKHKQNIKKVQLLHQSEQKLLEMEKKIMSSVIETEDRERKRFAMELHDGLGPLLSGTKLYVGELNYLSGKDKEKIIKEIKILIDQAIEDIRSISRNIMPDSFSENGLVKSLELFINKINPVKNIKIDFVNRLGDKIFSKGFEIIVYRIITELINNSIKHSGAKTISIEFTTIKNQFVILYKDNGKGFDVETTLEKSKGLGLKNIQDRIDSLGGFIKIKSSEGQGVDIEIRIDY